ncbi:10110_t:CDS:10, partial [Cetraspora pellucida]
LQNSLLALITSGNEMYEFFKRNSDKWNIIDFLNECYMEPFERKIDQYLRCLDTIAGCDKGKRKERAETLLNRYREASEKNSSATESTHSVLCHSRPLAKLQNQCWGTGDPLGCLMFKGYSPSWHWTHWAQMTHSDPQTDRKKARKWEKERSSKQVHLHQPTFVDGTAITNGTNNGTINGTETFIKRDSSSIGRTLRRRNQVNYAESSLEEETDSDYENKPKRVKKVSTQSLDRSSNSLPNLSDDNESDVSESDERESEAIIIKLGRLKKRLESQSRNEWIVGTINVSKKFKEYQMQLIDNVIEGKVKLAWNDKALTSIIVLVKQCPYSTFTSYEWKQVVNANPYIIKESVWANSFASSLSEACNNIAIGLDDDFISNGESDLSKKASRKRRLTISQTKKITENEHRFNYLDPLLRPFFCEDSKDYEIRLDKSVNGSLRRPDFSCRIDNVAILNSEVKPLGCTELQKDKDFVKVHLRSKSSINQLLNKGDDVNSYFMNLHYDRIYWSCPLLATKLVTERTLFPMLVLSIYHIDKIEQQVQRIANDYIDRRSSYYISPEQVEYIIEELGSSEFKELLRNMDTQAKANKTLTPEYLEWEAKLTELPASISILPKDLKERQQYVIEMVLERFPYLTLKHSFKYSNYFDFNRSVLCPICNKDHKKENIRVNIEGLWGSGDYVNTKTYHLYCYINKYQNSISIVTVKA